jgi:hypothetical protein
VQSSLPVGFPLMKNQGRPPFPFVLSAGMSAFFFSLFSFQKQINKKAKSHDLAFIRLTQRSPQQGSNYGSDFLINSLSTSESKKLTIAPIAAKITVLKTSSELRLGKTLKKVPPAVPLKVKLV